jgi:LPXTG-motif cell wall-anchored protein
LAFSLAGVIAAAGTAGMLGLDRAGAAAGPAVVAADTYPPRTPEPGETPKVPYHHGYKGLPFTGTEAVTMAVVAGGLILAGLVLISARRRRSDAGD